MFSPCTSAMDGQIDLHSSCPVPGPTLLDHLLKLSQARPGSPAYRMKHRGLWRTWNWSDTAREVEARHGLLAGLGVRSGDFVAIGGECNPRLYFYILAVQRAGAVPVILNPCAPPRDVETCHRTASFSLAIAGSGVVAGALAKGTRSAPEWAPTILCLDGKPADSYPTQRLIDEAEVWATKSTVATSAPTDQRALCLMDYGNDGRPELRTLSHADLTAAADCFIASSRLTADDELISFLPLSWIGDLVQFAAALTVGATVSAAENPSTLSLDLRRLAPTVMIAPQAFFRTFLNTIEADVGRSTGLARHLYAMTLRLAPVRRKSLRGRFLDIIFGAPLRNVTGLARCRLAFAVGGSVTPELVARFGALGVGLRMVQSATTFDDCPSDPVSQPGDVYPALIDVIHGERLVRHALLRADAYGRKIVVIDPDLDALTAIKPGSGFDDHDLAMSASAALSRLVCRHARRLGAADIAAIAVFAPPLSSIQGLRTPNGDWLVARIESLVPPVIGPETPGIAGFTLIEAGAL
jgi:hypothetical protein